MQGEIMMICIKTGCDVMNIVENELYHGDLFLAGNTFILKGVPLNGNGEYYYDIIPPHHTYNYDCITVSLEPMGIDQNGYAGFIFSDGLMPTSEFYDYVKKWEPKALAVFLPRG
jgi:hypothetical protein